MADKLLGLSRQKILALLKKKKSMTAQELAKEVAISSVGVRQHLTVLERDGLVGREQVHTPGRGRPKVVYHLTPTAERFFPQTSNPLLLQMIDHLSEVCGEKTLDRFFSSRMVQQKEEYRRRLQGLSLPEKVLELAKIRDENGYMADAEEEQDGNMIYLVEHHCPIYEVAHRFPQACHSELELFRRVLGVNIVRDKHLPRGDGMCRYRIVLPKKSKSRTR